MRELCQKHTQTVEFFAGQTGKLKDGQTKSEHTYQFSNNLRYFIVVVSGMNITQSKLKSQLDAAILFEPRVRVLVLSNNQHPNSYDLSPEETLRKMKVSDEAFNSLTYG